MKMLVLLARDLRVQPKNLIFYQENAYAIVRKKRPGNCCRNLSGA